MSAAGTSRALVDGARSLLARAAATYRRVPHLHARLVAAVNRLDAPLRVAIAGKVKAGKSTLLNALVGEELAPTDAGECTRIVTWYRDGITYRVILVPRRGEPRQVSFTREAGAIEVEIAPFAADDVAELNVEWPSASLREMTLIDTPGIASLSAGVSARTHRFLAPSEDRVVQADAVVYLMRHMHASDINFLEAFHDEDLSQATPVNAIAVLSRADEVGTGRIDSLASAQRIAARYRRDGKLRRLVQTVVPVAGLLAQAGTTLREAEYRALAAIASATREDADALCLSADRFASSPTTIPLSRAERGHLLDRLGLFGVRLAVALIRQRAAPNATTLATELVRRSGVRDLRQVLLTQFAERSDVLKARSALRALEGVLHERPVPGSEIVASELERLTSSAHELAELRLLNTIRAGGLKLKEQESADMERLLGAEGCALHTRLGLRPGTDESAIHQALHDNIGRWQRRAESPMSPRDIADAARVLIRTCEGMLASEVVAP